MDIQRKSRQLENQKLEKEIELEFQRTKNEMRMVHIEAEPNDVEITSTLRGFWEHDITNLSPIELVCRVKATNSVLFTVNKNSFRLKPMETFLLKVSRAAHRIRSHHLKIDVTPFTESFKPIHLLDYFTGPYPIKTFIIRYHGAPRYWSDALEMNDWSVGEELNEEWEAEMRKPSKERKASLETSEVSSINDNQDVEEDVEPVKTTLANMNISNVMMMSMQNLEDLKKENEESDSDSNSTFEYDESVASTMG